MKTSRQSAPLIVYSFARHLQDEETLLWQGKPVVSAYVWPKVLRDAALIVPVFYVAMWLESLRPGSAVAVGSIAFWIIGLIAYAFGTWAFVRETRLQASLTCYALTNKRILIKRLVTLPTQEKRPKVEDIALGRLHPKLLSGTRGIGTITFGLPTLDYALAFRAVPDAPEVYCLLTDARASLPQMKAETPYYSKLSASALPAFDLAEHLRGGEDVLWQGVPNKTAYLRRIVPPETFSATFLVALLGGLLMALHSVFTLIRLVGLAAAGGLIAFPILWWAYGHAAQRLFYFVTSQRVIIAKVSMRGAATLDERTLAQVGGMRLVPGRSGTGTLVFEKHFRFIWHGQGGTIATTEFSFKSIDNPLEVIALVKQARQAESLSVRVVGSSRSPAVVSKSGETRKL